MKKTKEKIGAELLAAMSSLDKAVALIYDVENIDAQCVCRLLKCKTEIKSVLNKDFDELAIRKKHSV